MRRDRLKLLLIAPTALDWSGQPIKERRLHLPCLTLPMLAAVTGDEVDTRIIYETVEDIPYDEKWDLIGLTGMGSGIVRAWQIADEFRSRSVPVVIGGIGASISDPAWSLAHCDAVIRGEADELLPQVITDFSANRLQPVYQAESLPDLSRLPVPRYELMNRWRMGIWRPVQTTRGCPHSCSFCSVTTFFHHSYRMRPIDQVIRDVKAARRYGSRHIAFIDDNMSGNLDYCADLWEALIPLRIIWMTQCSITLAENPSLLKLAHRSGCRLVSVGIESTDEQSLKSVGKEWNEPTRYRDWIAAFREHGIEVSTEMIVGFDTDDASALGRTLEFIQGNRIAVPRVHILTPIPGTPLFDELERTGRITRRDFAAYTGSRAVFKPAQMDPADLEKRYWQLYENLFSWRSILRRLVPSETSLGLYMKAVVWAANIRYRRHVKARISPGIL
ncbi:MAG: B12-binding domain-containing radical SAM protein [candidate division Zixibacteria bacterium]|nr:B12-binding domain-containing radical SAM protein [candidate division Zixibacteria bacterium]